jgi:hypothetical protein
VLIDGEEDEEPAEPTMEQTRVKPKRVPGLPIEEENE